MIAEIDNATVGTIKPRLPHIPLARHFPVQNRRARINFVNLQHQTITKRLIDQPKRLTHAFTGTTIHRHTGQTGFLVELGQVNGPTLFLEHVDHGNADQQLKDGGFQLPSKVKMAAKLRE